MDHRGRVLIQKPGTSQEGSASCKVLKPSESSVSTINEYKQPGSSSSSIQKSLTMPSPSTSSSSPQEHEMRRSRSLNNPSQTSQTMTLELFQRLAVLEVEKSIRRFTHMELCHATKNFSPEMALGEGGHGKVYRANLDNGHAVAVKVIKITQRSAEDLLQEVEILSDLKHENIVQVIGYCYGKDLHAVVYNLLNDSLKRKLKHLKWRDRMGVAIGTAKALDFLHSRSPPVIHRDVKSSNILLSDNCQPQLSDFGGAMIQQQPQQLSTGHKKLPICVIGTFGYMAPEYIMYGKVDEKTDVYSYGVVLLELITGKEALQTNQASNHESLVLWARSLLSSGLCERLIDPCLDGDYDQDEMKTMMIAARQCLLHSSSRRPEMKWIRMLFEQPDHWLEMQRKREELLNGISSRKEIGFCGNNESGATDSTTEDDDYVLR